MISRNRRDQRESKNFAKACGSGCSKAVGEILAGTSARDGAGFLPAAGGVARARPKSAKHGIVEPRSYPRGGPGLLIRYFPA